MKRELRLHGKLLSARVGDFVTAMLEDNSGVRQGVLTSTYGLHHVLITGETRTRYVCKPNMVIVPDENLFGSTRDFVRKFRRDLGIASLRDLPDK